MLSEVIIHCSDSDFGDMETIDRWHRERGWDSCGYHYVICNGIQRHGAAYDAGVDGLVQEGRPLRQPGAHCHGHNAHSIGVCLIGRHHFTARQLLQALPRLCGLLAHEGLGSGDVFGHRDFAAKSCPNIETELLRRLARMGGMA